MNPSQFEEASTKPFKLIYKEEIHKISKIPINYQALIQNVTLAFKDELPKNWTLQYHDADGDLIMLANDEDYKAMLECELESPSKSVKIVVKVLPDRSIGDLSGSKFNFCDMSRSEYIDDYSKILAYQQSGMKAEENAPKQNEEKIEEKVPEEPVPEVKEEAQEERFEEKVEDNQEVPEEQPQEAKEEDAQKENKAEHEEAVEQKEVVPQEPEEAQEEHVEIQDQIKEALEDNQAVEEPNQAWAPIEPSQEAEKVFDNTGYIINLGESIDQDKKDSGYVVRRESEFEEEEEKQVPQDKKAEVIEGVNIKMLMEKVMVEVREQMKEMITEVVHENIANIAGLVKDYLKDPSAFNLDISVKKAEAEARKEEPKGDVSFHFDVSCDGCGMVPISGVRYKCSVCDDFDYCKKCEETLEHPHPFLKIKGQKQIVNEVVPEPKNEEIEINVADEPKENNENENQEFVPKIEENIPIEKPVEVIEEVKQPEPKKEEEEEKVEPVIEKPVISMEDLKYFKEPVIQEPEEKKEEKPEEPSPFDITFVREVCTIPARATLKDKTIYKTVIIKNTGRKEWPLNCVAKNISGVPGVESKLIQLAPGQEFSGIFVLQNPGVAGEHESTWRLAYRDTKDTIQFAGKPFNLNLTIVNNDVRPPVQVPEPEIIKKPEVIMPPVEIKKPEPPKKDIMLDFPKGVQDLAKQVLEILPDVNKKELLEFISLSPKITLEELIDNYMMA